MGAVRHSAVAKPTIRTMARARASAMQAPGLVSVSVTAPASRACAWRSAREWAVRWKLRGHSRPVRVTLQLRMEFDPVEWAAKRQAVENELQALRARRLSRPWAYKAERVWVRSARILCGLVSVAIGLYIIDDAPNLTDRPLASLTLGTLVGGACVWFLGGWLIWWGIFDLAFGAGPTLAEDEERLRNEAAANVSTRASDSGGRN